MRAYYSSTIAEFRNASEMQVLGILATNNQFDLTDLQRNTWKYEIKHLKQSLESFEGRIVFEYTIPRMGKRIDVVLLINNIVFLLEYKVGDDKYLRSSVDQVLDYALDLKNFQKESFDKLLIPILFSTNAPSKNVDMQTYDDRIMQPICTNGSNLAEILNLVSKSFNEHPFDYSAWEDSIYMPTPTIIEAAQALYNEHDVKEISRSGSGDNLTITSNTIDGIIEFSKRKKQKSIVFVTGIPGAGKTLAGLNIANQRHNFAKEEHAVFLSGNGPLVAVLREALARDKAARKNIRKSDALKSVVSFIQNIHHFRDGCVGNEKAPAEKVAIFDEAQCAWTLEQISKFMRQKRGLLSLILANQSF